MFIALLSIRTRRVRTQAGSMTGSMVGAVVAGGFALAPGRIIGRLLDY